VRTVRTLTAIALALTLATATAACGDDDDDPGAGATDATDATGDETTGTAEGAEASDDGQTEGAAGGGPGAVEVSLVDYAFEGLPSSVEAGTTFTVVNESEDELHELVAFRLPDDEDRSVDELSELPPEDLVPALGEPVTVLLAEPDGPQIPAVGDGTVDEPGRYAIMCFIPTGADPGEYLAAAAEAEEGPPEGVAGGPPHFVQGMRAELTVE
jgi:hypothetical protein